MYKAGLEICFWVWYTNLVIGDFMFKYIDENLEKLKDSNAVNIVMVSPTSSKKGRKVYMQF